jgi:F0F1-type ATP synthase assembly protein I
MVVAFGRMLVAVLAGVCAGVLTSFGQAHLDGALNALVNSASAWLVAPFFVFAVWRRPCRSAPSPRSS